MGSGTTFIYFRNHTGAFGSRPIREGGNYKYINPLLFCEISENREFNQFQPLKGKILALLSDKVNNSLVEKSSVYYRDLNSGRWFCINENERYTPASLLKVPRMIAFFKLAESQPSILQKNIFYDGTFNDNKYEDIKPKKEIQAGYWYTIEDLIEYMIKYSDNNATRLLSENIDPDLLKEVYTDLGLSLPPSGIGVDFMSAKSYSYFFRVLYNSSYLSRQVSEKALSLLTLVDFDNGLMAGIPDNITLANKFGEGEFLTPEGQVISRELHECGIFYKPNHPYLLCVMTKGNNFDNLTGVIKDVSNLVYSNL